MNSEERRDGTESQRGLFDFSSEFSFFSKHLFVLKNQSPKLSGTMHSRSKPVLSGHESRENPNPTRQPPFKRPNCGQSACLF